MDASADAMAAGLRKLRLQIPDKAKLAASPDGAGAELQKRLVRKGIPAQYVRTLHGRPGLRRCCRTSEDGPAHDEETCAGEGDTAQ
eukprot:1971270-Pyramimonas_sp.AAC.1